MDEVVEAQEKFKGLVPLVYDIESMGLEKAKPAEYEYSVYLKREADRYIAHQKYKRCLAEADMNWWQSNRYSAAEMTERIRGNLEDAYQCSKLEQRYYKRYKIWLGLAEKLKDLI